MGTFDAILPAGGILPEAFATEVGVKSKALITYEGRTILARTLESLRESGHVNRIWLSGTEEVLAHPDAAGADFRIASGTSGPSSILNALKQVAQQENPPERVLIVTTDLPFLTGDVIRRFIERAPDADVVVPLIESQEYLARFPRADALFIPLRDGRWTAGCAYLFNVRAFIEAMPHLERVFAVRKSQIGMIRLLGPIFLFKFLTRTLVIEDVEAKIRSVLRCSGAGLRNSPPELAFDIDDSDDHAYALEVLARDNAR